MPNLENLIFYAAVANIAALATYGNLFSYVMNIFVHASKSEDVRATGFAAFIFKLTSCPLCLGFWPGFIFGWADHSLRMGLIVGACTADLAFVITVVFSLLEVDGQFNLLRMRGKK